MNASFLASTKIEYHDLNIAISSPVLSYTISFSFNVTQSVTIVWFAIAVELGIQAYTILDSRDDN